MSQVNVSNVALVEAASLDKLNASSYYWDTTSEHLYIMFANTLNGQLHYTKWVI